MKDPKKAVFEFPTESNPHISKEWLRQKKEELYSRDEGDVWEREYMAKFVRGGSRRVFPMLNNAILTPHDKVLQEIKKLGRKKLHWIVWADPAGASTFAVLYVAIDPYSKQVICVDEIYEQRQQEMTANKIGIRIKETCENYWDDPGEENSWRRGYDEAETWFANEMLDGFNQHWEPTQKSANNKDSGISLIKDLMLQNKLVISERCNKLFWELDNYQKDERGKFIKKNDHLIDCLRYILAADYYSLEDVEEVIKERDPMWRGARIEDDFPGLSENGPMADEFEDNSWLL